jgi:hypothetical protein
LIKKNRQFLAKPAETFRKAHKPEWRLPWMARGGLALERAAFGWNRHREVRSDAAIQESWSALRSLDRFACARDDDCGSTQM